MHCDLHAALCASQLEGRGYYPNLKLYSDAAAAAAAAGSAAAAGLGSFVDLERPELPTAAVLRLAARLLELGSAVTDEVARARARSTRRHPPPASPPIRAL